MEFSGQRPSCLYRPQPGVGLYTSVQCGHSCYPLVYFLFVSVRLLLFLDIFVSFLLVDCSDVTFFEVCNILDPSARKDVQELESGNIVELLSEYCRNDFMLMRLQCSVQRRFIFKRGSYDRFGGYVGFF